VCEFDYGFPVFSRSDIALEELYLQLLRGLLSDLFHEVREDDVRSVVLESLHDAFP